VVNSRSAASGRRLWTRVQLGGLGGVWLKDPRSRVSGSNGANSAAQWHPAQGPCDTGGSGCISVAWVASSLSARATTVLAEAMSVVARVAPVDDAVNRRQRWAGGT
jgi:hypothetical protein